MKLIKFYAVWCSPCTALNPMVKNVVEKTGIELEELDIDDTKNADLCVKYDVVSIPRLILLKDAEVVFDSTGILSRIALMQAITTNL